MRTFLVLVLVGAFTIAGCEKPGDSTKTTGGVATAAAEVACAHCVYKMAGVTACAPAVKVAGKNYLVTGTTVDLEKNDLHKAPKMCSLEGKIEGDRYVATKVDMK